MKKILSILLIGVLFICLSGCSNYKTKNANDSINDIPNNNELKKIIEKNFDGISQISDKTSSNPYDYINNQYYTNIVNLGDEAVPVLENMYNSGKLSGVDAYISALAVQDISKCDLYETYNLDWSSAEEFFELWKTNNCDFK